MDPIEDLPLPPAFFRPPPLRRTLLPPPLRRHLSPVPRFLSFPLFRATNSTWIGIFILRRLTFPRGATRIFSLSPLTTVTLSPYTNAPILRPFKSLILWRLFSLSPRSLHPSFDGGTSFSLRSGCLCPVPPLPLHLVVRRRLPFFHILLLGFFLGLRPPLPHGCYTGILYRCLP
jgi:hypothetical protein